VFVFIFNVVNLIFLYWTSIYFIQKCTLSHTHTHARIHTVTYYILFIYVLRDNNEAFRGLQLYYILFRKKTNSNRFLKTHIRLCVRDLFYFIAVKYYILFVSLSTTHVKRFKRMSANPGRRYYYEQRNIVHYYYYYTSYVLYL
jgi:hypothetical protein